MDGSGLGRDGLPVPAAGGDQVGRCLLSGGGEDVEVGEYGVGRGRERIGEQLAVLPPQRGRARRQIGEVVACGRRQRVVERKEGAGTDEVGRSRLKNPGEIRRVAAGNLGRQRCRVVVVRDRVEGDRADLGMLGLVGVGDAVEQSQMLGIAGPYGHAQRKPVRRLRRRHKGRWCKCQECGQTQCCCYNSLHFAPRSSEGFSSPRHQASAVPCLGWSEEFEIRKADRRRRAPHAVSLPCRGRRRRACPPLRRCSIQSDAGDSSRW